MMKKAIKKDKQITYENYPCKTVLISNIVSLLIYIIGAYIIFQLGIFWIFALYILYILFIEIKLIKTHCVNCYYYGKFCTFGKGKLSALFFDKGNPKKFLNMKITWVDILPDFLVSLVPVIIGIVLLIIKFNWILLALIIILLFLAFPGTGFVRGNLACRFCKQRELGCPAERMFKKAKK